MASKSRPPQQWVLHLSAAFAECSEHVAKYGQCVAAHVNDLEQGTCQKEYAGLGKCMKDSLARRKRLK
ncbi:hypothetical protein QOT17_020569 [Balamuthia mandrillaris]